MGRRRRSTALAWGIAAGLVLAVLGGLRAPILAASSASRAPDPTSFSDTASVTPDPMIIGSPATYTVTVRNTGTTTASAVTTTITITPSGTVTVGAPLPAGCTAAAQVVTCVTATLDASAAVSYDIPVTVNPSLPDGTNLRIEASTRDAAGGTGGTPPGGTITIARTMVDVEITKTGPVRVNADGTITYTLTVINHGPSDAPQVFVHDATNGNLTTITGLPAQCPPSGLTVSCNLGTLRPGEVITFEFTVRVNHGIPDGTIIPNCAVVDVGKPDTNPDNNISCINTIVGPGTLPTANIRVLKSAPATVEQNGTIRYTVSVTNRGPSTAGNVVISDPLNVPFDTATPLPAGCTLSDTTVLCMAGTLAVGQTVTYEFSVKLRPTDVPGTNILNCAAAISHNTLVRLLPRSCVQTEVVPPPDADVSITKTGPATVRPDGTISYSLTVTNHGPVDAADVVVRDPLGDLPVSVVSVPGGCDVIAGTVTCRLGTLAVDETKTLDITVAVDHGVAPGTPIENCADAYATTDDPDPANNESCTAASVTPVAPPMSHLSVHKDAPATVEADGTIVYTVSVTNDGPDPATNTVLNDPLDVPLDTAMVVLPSDCVLSSTTVVVCQAGTLAVGETKTFVFTVRLSPGAAPGTHIMNCESALSRSVLIREAPATSCAQTTVEPPPLADLAITKTAPGRVSPGGIITFSLAVTNHGPADATHVVVHDPLTGIPASVLAVPTGCAIADETVTCQLGTLAAGETTILDITVRVHGDAASGMVIDNCADAYAISDDPDIGNNESCAETIVGRTTPPSAVVDVRKDGPASAQPGHTISYTVTVTNRGPADAVNVIVSDPVDATVLTLVSLPTGCTGQDGTVACTVGVLAVGASKTFVISVLVGGRTPPGTRFDDCAEARSAATRLNEVSAPWCVQTDVVHLKPTLPVVPVTG